MLMIDLDFFKDVLEERIIQDDPDDLDYECDYVAKELFDSFPCIIDHRNSE